MTTPSSSLSLSWLVCAIVLTATYLMSSAVRSEAEVVDQYGLLGTVSSVNLTKYVGRWYQMYGNPLVFNTFERNA